MTTITQETKSTSGKNKGRTFTTRALVTISLLSALSYVLMLLESPPYLGFLRLEFSDVPAIIGAFQFGPISGLVIELIKNLIKAVTSTKTSGVGELANFIIRVSYVIPAAILYRKMKGKYKYLVSFGVATICMAIAGFLVNYFITLPLYAALYGGMDNVIAVASAILPVIKDKIGLILIGITPFNLFMGAFLGLVSHYTYRLLKKYL